MDIKSLNKELKRIFPKDQLLNSPEQLLLYGYDATPFQEPVLPDAVVLPDSAQQVVELVLLANRLEFPLIPRGAGSNLTGGTRPIQGGVVVSHQNMNRILDIDIVNMQAIVQPGVVTEQLQDRVEELGYFYPPDPQSKEFSTLGGNLAENAGGPRAVKYGVTRQYVLQVQAVLPQGQLVRLGAKTIKSVVGYDLLSLLIGSEGTLGIITEATLRLIPKPQSQATLLSWFDSMEQAAEAVTAIFQAKVLPSAIEFMDSFSIQCVEAVQPSGFPKQAQAVLLIELDGGKAEVLQNGQVVKEVLEKSGACQVQLANHLEQAEKLWKARRAIGPSLAQIAPLKFNEDVVVPLAKLPQAISKIHEIGKRHQLGCACFGHIGDGNIHVNFLTEPNQPEQVQRAEAAVAETFSLVIELGGSISGEHGVGTSKQSYIGLELGSEVIAVMQRIKHTLDPKGIMNPGKIF